MRNQVCNVLAFSSCRGASVNPWRRPVHAIASAAVITCAAVVLPIVAASAQEQSASVAQDAAQKQPIVSALEAFVISRDGAGKEVFSKKRRVDPGDTIEYRIVHRNQSGQSLNGFVINGRIPEGTTFVAKSQVAEQPGRFEVKLDGEKWQALPAMKTVVDENGEEKRVEAGPADYRAIRWTLADALANGAATGNRYRVRVLR